MGFNANDKNGERLYDWLDTEGLQLIFKAKDRCTLHSGRWNRGYNPDLCIVTKDKTEASLKAHRTILSYFPRNQHRTIFIKIGIQISLVKTILKPRWNFRKADWKSFTKSLDDNANSK